jgi:hypothetical protein
MEMETDLSKTFARVQRTPAGARLPACVVVSADDLAFVDSTTEMLEIQKKQIDGGLILEIRGVRS